VNSCFPQMELLAPAGDRNCLKAALMAGADAVYLGGKYFGARAFAQNFDESDLWWARRVTYSLNRKLYITLNTLVFDEEWSFLEKCLDFYESLAPDALILQDLGVALALAKRGSSIARHFSTQGAWNGLGGIDELRDLGISRIILPREMSLVEIKELMIRSPFALEVFVHGAMCYSISGRCFWSVALGNRSGNRGTCAQPCRKPYRVEEFDGPSWPFSPRDLRLYNRISELKQMKISALKIEGRMKGPDYVYQVVRTYRDIIDEKPLTQEREAALSDVFTRPFHEGFIDGVPEGEWTTSEQPGREGRPIGNFINRRKNGLSEIYSKSIINSGDGLAWNIAGQKHGTRITYVEPVGNKPGHYLVRGIPEDLAPRTELFRTSLSREETWELEWKREWERFPIDLFWSGNEGQSLAVETTLKNRAIRLITREVLSIALRKGLESGPIDERFRLLGENFLVKRNVTKALGKGLFVSPVELKKLKKALLEALIQVEIMPSIANGSLAKTASMPTFVDREKKKSSRPEFLIRIWNKAFPFLKGLKPDAWIVPFEGENLKIPSLPGEIRFWLPPLTNMDQIGKIVKSLEKLPTQEFLCLGWEAFELAKLLPQHKFRLDWCFNLTNSHALDFVASRNLGTTCSREWPRRNHFSKENNTVWTISWNPLVSFSRFPPRLPLNKIITNPHKDRFFLKELRNGIYGLFLVDKPTTFHIPQGVSIQLDLAIGPHESPVKIAGELEKLVGFFKPKPIEIEKY